MKRKRQKPQHIKRPQEYIYILYLPPYSLINSYFFFSNCGYDSPEPEAAVTLLTMDHGSFSGRFLQFRLCIRDDCLQGTYSFPGIFSFFLLLRTVAHFCFILKLSALVSGIRPSHHHRGCLSFFFFSIIVPPSCVPSLIAVVYYKF